jgi:hypothetical protein
MCSPLGEGAPAYRSHWHAMMRLLIVRDAPSPMWRALVPGIRPHRPQKRSGARALPLRRGVPARLQRRCGQVVRGAAARNLGALVAAAAGHWQAPALAALAARPGLASQAPAAGKHDAEGASVRAPAANEPDPGAGEQREQHPARR